MAGTDPFPKLQDDLSVSEQSSGGESYFIVKDPITQRYFRLRPPEYFILRQFDGHTSPDDIARRVQFAQILYVAAPSR